jgi:hypothetical protein
MTRLPSAVVSTSFSDSERILRQTNRLPLKPQQRQTPYVLGRLEQRTIERAGHPALCVSKSSFCPRISYTVDHDRSEH